MQRVLLFLGVLFFVASCQKEQGVSTDVSSTSFSQFMEDHNPYFCNNPTEAEAGQLYHYEGKTWLWGGHEESQAFDISGWSLQIENLGSGLGRELIKALIFPEYETTTNQNIKNDEQMIVVKGKQEVRLYSLDLLTKHELVNDKIDGQPILVGYCPLADLAVVYERIYCDVELFFALSGYTYIEKDEKAGRNNTDQNTEIESFILWDRNTESLWYPFSNVAVSGKMNRQKMKLYDKTRWEIMSYGKAIEKFGGKAKVLSYQQTLDLEVELKNANLNQSIDCN